MENFNQTASSNNLNQLNIDNQLLQDALKVSGGDQKSTIEEALKLLVQLSRQQEIRSLRGKLVWEGSLGEMRSSHAT